MCIINIIKTNQNNLILTVKINCDTFIPTVSHIIDAFHKPFNRSTITSTVQTVKIYTSSFSFDIISL